MNEKTSKFFSNVFFTNRCELCGEVIEFNERRCQSCNKLTKIKPPYCEYCGYSKDDCVCKKHKNEYKQIVAPYYYENSVVSAVHNLKNRDMPFLAKGHAKQMADVILQTYGDVNFDYITFVPFRPLHKLKRGFNQAELLANELSKYINAPCVCLLKKVRYTGVQHKKTKQQRQAGVFGAFDVCKDYKNKLNGKTVLLVDDVKTTGSTLNECAKMLKIYSANAVYCASFALTRLDRKDKKKK